MGPLMVALTSTPDHRATATHRLVGEPHHTERVSSLADACASCLLCDRKAFVLVMGACYQFRAFCSFTCLTVYDLAFGWD